eukprot:362659-Chlamydomonas_euryale.AAC.3
MDRPMLSRKMGPSHWERANTKGGEPIRRISGRSPNTGGTYHGEGPAGGACQAGRANQRAGHAKQVGPTGGRGRPSRSGQPAGGACQAGRANQRAGQAKQVGPTSGRGMPSRLGQPAGGACQPGRANQRAGHAKQ